MSSKTSETVLLDELRDVFAEVFRIPTAEIGADTQFGELPQWDSMGHMDLMVALESKFGVEISAETISQLVSIPAIIAHIQAKQNG
jgi:acyl carrier protein